MDKSYKIVFCGDSSVGKTSIIKRFTTQKYEQNTASTINVDFSSCEIKVNDETYRLQVWDTAGQEAYRSISVSYFRNAKGIFLVYDLTSRETFNKLEDWIDLIQSNTLGVPFVIFGNKSDLVDNQCVSEEEAISYAERHETMSFMGSAKDGINIEEAFYELTKLMIDSSVETEQEGVTLKEKQEKKTGCC